MSVKRSNSKQLRDYPGYSGNFSVTHSVDNSIDDMDKTYSKNWEPPVDYQESLDLDKKWPADIKYHQKYQPSSVASTDQYDSEGNPKTLKRVLVRFAERTSLQGVPYINVSKMWYAKLIWIVLFLIAIGIMVLHLYILINSYIAFGKHTKIQLGFSSLEFPTVTVCNVNPLRASQLSFAQPELREFVRSTRPEKVVSSLKQQGPAPPLGPNNPNTNSSPNPNPNPSPNPNPNPSPNPNPNPKPNPNQGGNPGGSTTQPPPPASGRKKRFIDDLEFNFTNTRRQFHVEDKKRRPSGRRSNIKELRSEFNYLFSSHDRDTRISMGHNLTDMLVSCTFSGVVCNASQFRIHPTSTFGNCYTLESSEFVSYRSGPRDGLELILFLETDEYISTIASGNGAHVQIHDTNTWPNPEVDGMAVSAAMETNIAMRMVQIERLGDPYGICEEGDTFLAKYGTKYTRQTCQLYCVQERIVSKCKCYDEEKYELHNTIITNKNGAVIPACRKKKDVQCMLSVEAAWETGDFTCSCHNPCNETTYQRLVTSRSWPSDAYARILVQYLCNNRNETECDRYEQMDPRKLSQNFIKINVYFEDLNFEDITEFPDYEDVQFFSDIGGTIGLWVGLSMLSLAEVGQFIAELFHFLCCVKPNREKRVKQRKQHIDRSKHWDNTTPDDPARQSHSHRFSDMDRQQYMY